MKLIKRIRRNMYAQLAERNLRRQKVRTILAAIGIIIGVMAITSMGILGNTLKLSVSESFSDVGDKLVIYPAMGEDSVTQDQVNRMERIAGIEHIIPYRSSGEAVEYRDETSYGTVYRMKESDLRQLVEIESGRFFKEGSTDCVLGSSVASNLELDVGSKIEIEDTRLRVVGILKERGMAVDISTDSGVFVSHDMYSKLYPDAEEDYRQVIVVVEDIALVDTVKTELEDTLNKREKKIEIFAANSINEQIESAFQSISMFLMGIGSISLLVAGVSILNVMLMSTMERTREIGIMKAVGASRSDVLRMFLLEALILGIIASLLGGIVTVVGSFTLIYFIMGDITYFFDPTTFLYVIAGIFFGIITSLIGGLYPAWKASMMNPLDALRYE
ncbi:ABC transporter permease [Methanohalophilus sp. RSK]|uniref:ABC transporter permease n=1 Tax=Methanohalophilus sp. RSK TaxID=2485783 RepID=UPI000F43D6BC|nr:ABC transporter permease [Methanohalophilus sp. RSK]RNI12065.1 ABC transporter permease [Methanohalophilus sp. RSK]